MFAPNENNSSRLFKARERGVLPKQCLDVDDISTALGGTKASTVEKLSSQINKRIESQRDRVGGWVLEIVAILNGIYKCQ